MRLEITTLISCFHLQIHFKFILKNQPSIENFFNYEDRIRKILLGCVVDKFSCGQCTSTNMFETYRHLSPRIAEHKGMSIIGEVKCFFSNSSQTSIHEHALQESHNIISCYFFIIHK